MLPYVQNPYDFASTFDRTQNRAGVDMYVINKITDGSQTRLHLDIAPAGTPASCNSLR